MKLEIKPSTAKNKKWTAIFYDDEGKKIKTSQFGDIHNSVIAVIKTIPSIKTKSAEPNTEIAIRKIWLRVII
jgi:hypothetical protein